MELKEYNEIDDYDTISKWATSIGQTPPPALILPKGVLIVDKGKKVACAFVYEAVCTPLAVIEWIFFKPNIKAKEKIEALHRMVDFLEYVAVKDEHPCIMVGSAYSGIVKQLKKRGFNTMLTGATHLVKVIEGV